MRSVEKSREKRKSTREETTYDLADFIAEAERIHSSWSIKDEDVQLAPIEQEHRRHLQRIATWTMVGVVAAATSFSIATGNLEILGWLATAAVAFLTGLVYRGVTHGKQRHKGSEQGDDYADDG